VSRYYAEDVLNFLEGKLTEPAILFGLSAGGAVAVASAAYQPELVRGVIAGDSPFDLEVLVNWMTSDGFKSRFTALREIAGAQLSTAELTRAIAEIPVQIPGQDAMVNYADAPEMDAVKIQQLALTLKHMDPGVLEYHAEGRALEFLEGFDLDELLPKISCPVLLLQANPELGGMMTNAAVQYVQSILPDAQHVRFERAGHDLGLDSWQVSELLRVVVSFMEGL
jgi:pimeloyl-ACP methyl ester carboxylesterase